MPKSRLEKMLEPDREAYEAPESALLSRRETPAEYELGA